MHKILRIIARIQHGERSGFTMIEILIVIAVLGILAAIIIPNVSTYLDTGHVTAANTELATVKTAVAAYKGIIPWHSRVLPSLMAAAQATHNRSWLPILPLTLTLPISSAPMKLIILES
jgi:type IV pilus assembly protein PilA